MRYGVPLEFQLLLFVCFRIWSHFQDQDRSTLTLIRLPIKFLAALNPNALLRLWIDPDLILSNSYRHTTPSDGMITR